MCDTNNYVAILSLQGSPLDCYASGSSFTPFDPPGRSSDRDFFSVADIGESSVVQTVITPLTLHSLLILRLISTYLSHPGLSAANIKDFGELAG